MPQSLNRDGIEGVSHAPEPGAGRVEIPSLDGLRAISIVLVLAGHAIKVGHHPLWFRVAFLHADLGVRVFFIISGFLITTLLLNERDQFGDISLRNFYIRRAFRILPAFLLYVGAVALLSIFGVTYVPGWYWLYVATYTVNFGPFGVWALIHLWSLSVEEQFYLLWPLVVKVARRRTCIVVAVLAIFASPFIHVLYRFGVPEMPMYAFPLVCGPIAMGCLLAINSRRVRDAVLSSKLLSDGRTLLFALPVIALLDVIPESIPGVHGALPAVLIGIVTYSLVTLCVARLVFLPTGLAGRVLNSAAAVLIGKLSYSLYLWQQLFLNPFSRPTISTPFPVNCLLILAAASASYWGLEVRFLDLRKRFRPRLQTV